MENRLLTQYRGFLSSLGLSFEMLNVSQSEQWYTDLQEFIWNFYLSKSDEEITNSIVAMKNAACKMLYEIDFCPFEKLTGVRWEDMLRANISRTGKPEGGFKRVFLPWLHTVTSSAHYNFTLPRPMNAEWVKCHVKHPLLSQPEYVAQECVEIDGELYTYGESRIISDRLLIDTDRSATPSLYFVQPTTVFDEHLLPLLVEQPEWLMALEISSLLIELSSHDSLVHAVFLEGDKKIFEFTNKDPLMKKLNQVRYHCFLMYELNFSRMMRAMFDSICQANPTLRENIMDLLSRVRSLTERWPSILRQYIMHIVTERVRRLIWLDADPENPWLEKYFVGLQNGNVDLPPLNATDEYLNIFIHIDPDKGALVYEDPPNKELQEIPFSDMARFMYECHVTV